MVPKKHIVKAAICIAKACFLGILRTLVGFTAPFVVPIVLLFVKKEDGTLPRWVRWDDNNISINGDGWARKLEDGTWETVRVPGVTNCVPYSDPSYTGDAYYAPGHSPHSFWARYVWLGLRNRCSKLSEILGYDMTPEVDADREFWGDPKTSSDMPSYEGWWLSRAGGAYHFYMVKRLGSKLIRINMGYKVWLENVFKVKTANVVFIPFSQKDWKEPVQTATEDNGA